MRKSNNSNTSNTIYVMGVALESTSGIDTGVCIWGVTRSSMYANTPYRRTHFEQFEVEGSPTSQALEIADASREFYPLALVLEQRLSPVAERIAFCIETRYIIPTFFRQTPAQAATTQDSSLNDAARHAKTFLMRARNDDKLRDAAWGLPERRISSRTNERIRVDGRRVPRHPARRGSARARP